MRQPIKPASTLHYNEAEKIIKCEVSYEIGQKRIQSAMRNIQGGVKIKWSKYKKTMRIRIVVKWFFKWNLTFAWGFRSIAKFGKIGNIFASERFCINLNHNFFGLILMMLQDQKFAWRWNHYLEFGLDLASKKYIGMLLNFLNFNSIFWLTSNQSNLNPIWHQNWLKNWFWINWEGSLRFLF